MNKKKVSIIISVLVVLALMITFIALEAKTEVNKSVESNTIVEESVDNNSTEDSKDVVITNETKDLVNKTVDAINNDEDISTTEVIESTEQEAEEVTDEGAESLTENDARVEQEDISYDGDITGNGMSLLGPYQGLTYYNQGDSRWANIPYTSIGNYSQTMKSSGCGPTSAAMVVSSSKGTILPTTMAQLFVDNRYRTANNGTAWAAFPFIADYFNFNEYRVTSNFDTMTSYLRQDKDNDGQADYFVIASCGSGLWTSGGHYITLVRDAGGTITVYDPYLYAGKFNTASRRPAGVVVSGNSAFVSEYSFRKYSNVSQYWIFSNDKGAGNNNTSQPSSPSGSSVNYTRYVATQSAPLNVRRTAGGPVIGSLRKGTAVIVKEVYGGWSRISNPMNGWVSTGYLSGSYVSGGTGSSSNSTSYTTSTGATYRLKAATTLRRNSNMTGTAYQYKANTRVKVIRHQSSSVDYVYIPATGRYAYCYKSAFGSASSSSSNTYKSTSSTYKRLKYATTLRGNSNMTGAVYNYLAQTQVQILSYPRSGVAYVKVVKTGRYAYVYTSALR